MTFRLMLHLSPSDAMSHASACVSDCKVRKKTGQSRKLSLFAAEAPAAPAASTVAFASPASMAATQGVDFICKCEHEIACEGGKT